MKEDEQRRLHTGTQTPQGQFSVSILSVIIVSSTLNILVIGGLVLILILFIIKAQRNAGTVLSKVSIYLQGYFASNAYTLIK